MTICGATNVKQFGQYDDISIAVNAMTQIIPFTDMRDLLSYLLPRPFIKSMTEYERYYSYTLYS